MSGRAKVALTPMWIFYVSFFVYPIPLGRHKPKTFSINYNPTIIERTTNVQPITGYHEFTILINKSIFTTSIFHTGHSFCKDTCIIPYARNYIFSCLVNISPFIVCPFYGSHPLMEMTDLFPHTIADNATTGTNKPPFMVRVLNFSISFFTRRFIGKLFYCYP